MLGEKIKTLRNAKGFSQEDLASRIYVVRQTVSKWETNSSVPDPELLQNIADIFGIAVSELLEVATKN